MSHEFNKNKGENEISKTFIFKTKCGKNDITSLWVPAMEEYCTYYNRVSKWICDNLTEMRIGDLAQYIDNHGSAYYSAVTDVTKKDLPLYKIFKKGFSGLCADNALYCAIAKLNPEGYDGNMFGLSETYYRRQGYIANVFGNYRTKMNAGLKVGCAKWKKFDTNDVDDEILMEQVIVDVVKYDIDSKNEFKEYIEVLKCREENPKLLETIERLECLYGYYSQHEEDIKKKIEELVVEELKTFGGCVRKSMTSCTITVQDFVMERIGNTGYRINLTFNKKPYVLGLLGNRQVVRYVDGDRVELVDIVNNHGNQITFNLKNGELFVHLTSGVDFSKEESSMENIVGVDVNIKHSMLASSIVDDGNVNGYINIYKELVNDDEFVSTFGDSESGLNELELYRQMAESVNFGLMETDSLFERYVQQWKGSDSDSRLARRERVVGKVFDRIVKTNGDVHVVNYIHAVKMLRAKCKAYFVLKQKYYEKQKEYDDAQGYTDESTASKETMDKRRFENPFVETDVAKELLGKLACVEQDIIGCRDNIVTYAFNVFRRNGYDTISLEYLDSSQFKKIGMGAPTPKSLLKYHKLEGKTVEEVESIISEKGLKKNLYVFKFGDNGLLSDIEYSDEGLIRKKKADFGNIITKAIHFADIKDKFVQLTNNSDMGVVFCPSAFTSQMDSKTHRLYFVEGLDGNGKKKYVLANKWSVRRQQERHINGLNADFNSACNCQHIAYDPILRDAMTIKVEAGKGMYNKPSYDIRKKFKKNLSAATLKTFIKLGNTVKGMIVNGQFVEMES